MRYKTVATIAAVAALLFGCGGASSTSGTSAPSTTSERPPPAAFVGGSSAGTLPNGLGVEMSLGSPREQLGSNIPYKIELHNSSSQPKTIGEGNIDCVLGGFAPALYDTKGKFPADKPPLASSCKQTTTLAAGRRATFTGWVPAQRMTFKPGARHGYFTVALVNVLGAKSGTGVRDSAKVTPIPVAFDAPDLTVRLQVPNHAVIAGSMIKGTVVFDNAGHTHIPAGCERTPNFLIALNVMRAGQETLVNPQYTQPNPSTPCIGREIVLEPGTTRLPFAISAKYYDCYPPLPSGVHLIDGPYLPTCIRPHVPAPLPSGTYQLVYNGAAGVGAAVVPPASVEIRRSK